MLQGNSAGIFPRLNPLWRNTAYFLLTAVRGGRILRAMDTLPKQAAAKKRRVRFPGIVGHARSLGVSRIHLYFVLTGARRSPRVEAYAAKHITSKSGHEQNLHAHEAHGSGQSS